MAFSDLCKISNAFKVVENDSDQSERIMEENSMVRDLITKILDESGPSDVHSAPKTSDKPLDIGLPPINSAHYQNHDGSSLIPSNFNPFQDPYNYMNQDQNGFNYNLQNGFQTSFNNFQENDANLNGLLGLGLGLDPIADANDSVTPEQLNLLRLAAQEIGGAQFASPNSKYDYNFFDNSQRNAMQEPNMFANNFNQPNSLNLENYNFNSNLDSNLFPNTNGMRYPNKFNMENYMKENQNSAQDTDVLSFCINQLGLSERPRDDIMQNNLNEFKMPLEMNTYQTDDLYNKVDERNKMYNFNRNFQQAPPNVTNKYPDNFYVSDSIKNANENKFQMNQNYDFPNANSNFKPNGFHQNPNEFMPRQSLNQMMRDPPPNGFMNEQRGFENPAVQNSMHQAALLRQNQELARQMNLLMRNRPPPNQLNVDVSFLHENVPFNLGALLGRSPPVQPPVLPSPLTDLPPHLAPFYTMRNMRVQNTSSAILHHRLDACYEQWRQLERERKRTEARLALAYPGRAVSSSNSIPVPRLPPAPTRVDRLTVDMCREHTKVLTLMGKMETLRASVCIAQNKKLNRSDDPKITVLKRGQENVAADGKQGDNAMDPASFDPSTWKDDVKNLAEIAPHSEVEGAMLSWRAAVSAVQAARRRELHAGNNANPDPILQLAAAVKQLAVCARRARCAMWCDVTLTVALAPHSSGTPPQAQNEKSPPKQVSPETSQKPAEAANTTCNSNNTTKPAASDAKEEKPTEQPATTKPSTTTTTATTQETKQEQNNNGTTVNNANKPKAQPEKTQRRSQNYRHKVNQGRPNDFYQKNQRYDNRFMQNRHPYYLATGPIN